MNIFNFLSGWKTYIVAVAMVIVGLYQKDTQLVLEGVGLAALRAGVSKVGK